MLIFLFRDAKRDRHQQDVEHHARPDQNGKQPKPDQPREIKGDFKPIETNVKGIYVGEVMPRLAKQMDKATLVRSLNYTPAGLFNHTAAIYQLMTGYTPDRVSPSGQLSATCDSGTPVSGR